jgi:hypothetical protein
MYKFCVFGSNGLRYDSVSIAAQYTAEVTVQFNDHNGTMVIPAEQEAGDPPRVDLCAINAFLESDHSKPAVVRTLIYSQEDGAFYITLKY